MKKGIQLWVNDSPKWVGGLYYKRNILFQLLQNDYIVNNYKFIINVYRENLSYFEALKNNCILSATDFSSRLGVKKLYYDELVHGVRYAFPAEDNKFRRKLNVTSIDWIPDFQHNVYPEYFTEEELTKRDTRYNSIYESKMPLILSSQSAKSDFENFYGKREGVYVVPFVSFIEPEISKMSYNMEEDVLSKLGLKNIQYVCISNQFWKHKNHIVVLKAIKLLAEQLPTLKLQFVFTGLPEDYRNPEYFKSLTNILEDNDVKRYTKILGFLDRVEQLVVMKHAKFIIQPSLFEGWGTVVEDAKVLDKLILLSDIPVHREQMNENCTLFNPHDPNDLVTKIIEVNRIEHKDNIDNGIKDMYHRAKIYSTEFAHLLKDFA